MKISNFRLNIAHAADGSAELTLMHGGDRYVMELTADQRRSLGLNLLDPTTAEADTAQEAEA